MVFWLLITILAASAYYVNFSSRYEGGWMNFFFRQFPIWGIWIILSLALYIFIAYSKKQAYSWGQHLLGHLVLLSSILVLVHFYFKLYNLILSGEAITWAKIFHPDNRVLILYYFQNALVYLVVCGIIYGWFWNQNLQEAQLEKAALNAQLHETRMKVLSAQLHPHFLFNALNSIATLVRKNENAKAVEAIADIGELLRTSLQSNPQQRIRLQDELKFIENYLRIEQLRFPTKLKLNWHIDEKATKAKIPALILQPLVENAIKHGISQMEKPGHLTIEVTEHSGNLNLMVKDDGPGLSANWNWQKQNGIGLSNIKSRLELLYGKNYSFELKNGAGTIANISIPFEY